jgi:hypothetical protein
MHWAAVDYDTGTIYIGKITKIDEVSKNAYFLSKMGGNHYKVKNKGMSIDSFHLSQVFFNFLFIIIFIQDTHITTSFPGSFLLWRKNPGRSWSHKPPDFGGKLNLISGKGSREVCLLRLENIAVL